MNINIPADIGNNVAAQEIKSALLTAVVAGTDVTEYQIGSIGPCNTAVGIGGATLTLQAGAGTFTANDTNYTTITVNKRTAGGAAVAIAIGSTALTIANSTGSMAAWANVKLKVVSGASVSPNDTITVAITHGGSGLAVPASILELFASIG